MDNAASIVMVSLHVSRWGARKRVPINKLHAHVETDKSRLGAHKRLAECERLSTLCGLEMRARTRLRELALPSGLAGMLVLPAGVIPQMQTDMAEYRAEFNRLADEFARQDYPGIVAGAAAILGDLYDPRDYPDSVRGLFAFELRCFSLAAPGGSGIEEVDPEFVAQQRAEFSRQMGEIRSEGVAALRCGFADLVDHIVRIVSEPGDGKKRVIKSATFEKFAEFCETFQARNVFGDAELADLVGKARAVLADADPESLRKSVAIRSHVAAGMAQVKAAADAAVIALGRRIVVAAESEEVA